MGLSYVCGRILPALPQVQSGLVDAELGACQ